MFDSPFTYCAVCKEGVLLDQTQADCAREHDCKVAKCPLKAYFATPDASRTVPDPDRKRDTSIT